MRIKCNCLNLPKNLHTLPNNPSAGIRSQRRQNPDNNSTFYKRSCQYSDNVSGYKDRILMWYVNAKDPKLSIRPRTFVVPYGQPWSSFSSSQICLKMACGWKAVIWLLTSSPWVIADQVESSTRSQICSLLWRTRDENILHPSLL